MNCLVILLLLLSSHARYGSFAKLESKENQTEVGQQRSARVHRVSDDEFPVKEDRYAKSTMNEGTIKQTFSLGSHKLEKFLSDLPNLSDLIQREAQLFKELNVILKELARDGATTLKNIDLAINEITDAAASTSSIKPVSRNTNDLRNLLNSPEELDIYRQDPQDSDKTKSRPSISRIKSTNDLELKTVKNIAQYLDTVLLEIQNHITYVRNVFEKLCRKHHSMSSVESNGSNREKFASTNQPKKVSIL